MENSCCVCPEGEPAQVLESAVVRAKIRHRCAECRKIIQPGERYEYNRCVSGGFWETYKICISCRSIGLDLLPCGWFFGGMWLTIQDCLGLRNEDMPETWLKPHKLERKG